MPRFGSLPLTHAPKDANTYECRADQLLTGQINVTPTRRKHNELESWVSSTAGIAVATQPILRVLHIQCETIAEGTDRHQRCFMVSITEALCEQICKDWNLPVDLLGLLAEVSDRFGRCVNEDGAAMIKHRCYFINCKADPEDQNNALLVVKHLVADQHTLAVLATSRPLHEIDLAPILNTARKASSNPMLLPTALADLMVTAEAAGTTKIDDTLSQLERGNRALLHSASKLSTTVDQVEHTAQTLNDVRNALGRSERRLRSLALLLATCMAEIGMLSIIAPPHPQWDTAAAERILQGHNANLRSDVDHLLLQVQNNNARAQTQQQVVYNFMNTREAISGRLIAAAGMRDGAAMKALALLTTVFLPGTYLATLFAMPIIDWSKSRLPGGPFVLYWIVTILLTVTVLSAWALWMRRSDGVYKRRLLKGEKTV